MPVETRLPVDVKQTVVGWGERARNLVSFGRTLRTVPDEGLPIPGRVIPMRRYHPDEKDINKKLEPYKVQKSVSQLLVEFGEDPQSFTLSARQESRLLQSSLWIDQDFRIKRGRGAYAALSSEDPDTQTLKIQRDSLKRAVRYREGKYGKEHEITQAKKEKFQQVTLDLFDRLNIQHEARLRAEIEDIKSARPLASKVREQVDPNNILDEEGAWDKMATSFRRFRLGWRPQIPRLRNVGLAAVIVFGMAGSAVEIGSASRSGLDLSFPTLSRFYERFHFWGSPDTKSPIADVYEFERANARMAAILDLQHHFGKTTNGQLTNEQKRIVSKLQEFSLEEEGEFKALLVQYLPDYNNEN